MTQTDNRRRDQLIADIEELSAKHPECQELPPVNEVGA
jgi:hypothetical protein